MFNTNITNLRQNIFDIFANTIKYNEPVNVSTKVGNVVIISEQEYNDLIAILELSSNPAMYMDTL